MMGKPGAQSGFTLLEVLISVGIFSTILGIALAIMMPFQTYQTTSSIEETAQIVAETAVHKIIEDLQEISVANGQLDPLNPADSTRFKFRRVTDITTDPPGVGNFIEWQFEYTEANDGVDNNGNGLIDEGRLVRRMYDAGGSVETSTVIAADIMEWDTTVSLNGVSFTRNGNKIEVSISIEKPNPENYTEKKTRANFQTTITLLN